MINSTFSKIFIAQDEFLRFHMYKHIINGDYNPEESCDKDQEESNEEAEEENSDENPEESDDETEEDEDNIESDDDNVEFSSIIVLNCVESFKTR